MEYNIQCLRTICIRKNNMLPWQQENAMRQKHVDKQTHKSKQETKSLFLEGQIVVTR